MINRKSARPQNGHVISVSDIRFVHLRHLTIRAILCSTMEDYGHQCGQANGDDQRPGITSIVMTSAAMGTTAGAIAFHFAAFAAGDHGHNNWISSQFEHLQVGLRVPSQHNTWPSLQPQAPPWHTLSLFTWFIRFLRAF